MLRSWWQKTSNKLDAVVILMLVVLIALVVVIVQAYIFKVNVPGLSGKNLWDWLQLLIVPAILAIGGYLFNRALSSNQQAATDENQREAVLQAYLDKMSKLLLDKDNPLRQSQPEEEVRTLARTLTLTVLEQVGEKRRRNVLQFLKEACLILKDPCIIDLHGANLKDANLRDINLKGVNLKEAYLYGADLSGEDTDLSEACLRRAKLNNAKLNNAKLNNADLSEARLPKANLEKANLDGANLSGANLYHADLSRANLWSANLSEADLEEANLQGANLEGANLTGAKVTTEQLDKTFTLKGATMPDGTEHD